jgi:hypothetical protein
MRQTPSGGIMDVADLLGKGASWQEEENFYVGRREHGIG